MTSLTTTRRHIKQAAAQREQEQRSQQSITAADHYTAADRATADNFAAAEMFAEFLAEEIEVPATPKEVRELVKHNGKEYSVRCYNGCWSICIQYEAFDVSTRHYALVATTWRIRQVDVDGRLGRAILRTLAAKQVAA